MPCYYIDTDDGITFVRDEIGHQLPHSREAEQLALRCLPEMARDAMPKGDGRTFNVSIRDESGTTLYAAQLNLEGRWLIATA